MSNNDSIRAMVDAVEAGKTLEVEKHFEDAITAKLHDAIEVRRQEIASSLMGQEDEVAEYEEDAAEEAAEEDTQEEQEDDDSHGL